jgi:O-antigen/teichoic acid export membrane protein
VQELRRLTGWAHAGFVTAGAQTAVQLLGLLSGIVIIRSLAIDEYAYYTIANTALGAMSLMTDSGVTSGVFAEGGKVWQDRARLGAVLSAGLAIRKRLSGLAVLVAVPLLGLLLRRQGASWLELTLLIASILPLYLSTVTAQLLETVPRLHQRLLPLYSIQVGTNVGRLAIVALLIPVWPFAAVASLVAAVPQWWANWRLRRLAATQADWHASADTEARKRLSLQVRRTLPSTIYYVFSGQLTIWLIAIFGRADSVAAVGALGRLAIAVGIPSAMFAAVAIPRYARIPAADRSRVVRRYWQSQLVLAFTCLILVGALATFPRAVLAVLGPHYSGLEREAVLMAVSSVVWILAGSAHSLAAARGVVAPPLLVVPYCIIGQALLVLLLPMQTVTGVIWAGLLSAASQWLLHTAYFIWTARRAPAATS